MTRRPRGSRRVGFVGLLEELRRRFPDEGDPAAAVASGAVLVAGRIVTNPAARVRQDDPIAIRRPKPLRGTQKLGPALDWFGVDVTGRVALDLGASTGGFTTVLLERGARIVYAVDAGHGQLLGSLRQDPRVHNLEGVNLGSLDRSSVPDTVEVVSLDLSFLALAAAVPQVEHLRWSASADLVALVKPMYELGLEMPPTDPARQEQAVDAACDGIEAGGWRVLDRRRSPVQGARGAVEFLVHARRS